MHENNKNINHWSYVEDHSQKWLENVICINEQDVPSEEEAFSFCFPSRRKKQSCEKKMNIFLDGVEGVAHGYYLCIYVYLFGCIRTADCTNHKKYLQSIVGVMQKVTHESGWQMLFA